jgi:hypothetical protein
MFQNVSLSGRDGWGMGMDSLVLLRFLLHYTFQVLLLLKLYLCNPSAGNEHPQTIRCDFKRRYFPEVICRLKK